MILSVSRKTDVPYFYNKWFLQRLKDEKIAINLPQYNKIYEYELTPNNIECIVFWTKDTHNFHQCIDFMLDKEFNFYFQFTLNGYSDVFEPNVRPLEDRIKEFKALSSKIGKDKVIWRYDPIILSSITDLEYHKKQFAYLANELKDYTNKVIVSYMDFYAKLNSVCEELEKSKGILIYDIMANKSHVQELSLYLKDVATKNNLDIESCAENGLEEYGINKAACIDGNLMNKIFGLDINHVKDKSQRKECGCMKSIDVGIYNSCLFDCIYCYANNANKDFRLKTFKNNIDSEKLYLEQ